MILVLLNRAELALADCGRIDGVNVRDKNDAQASYVATIERRIRWADRAMNTRNVGQLVTWTVVLFAGAGVALSQVIEGAPEITAAVLGFVVVVGQGLDRLLGRRADGAASMDMMRRELTKARRMYVAEAGPYATDDRFDVFVTNCEAILDRYDAESVDQLSNDGRLDR